MNNQRRVLAELLSIDAWHDPIRVDSTTSNVHVELSFQQGRIGGDDDKFPFTFNVSLKRAILTVKVEAPLEIDRKTVARHIPANQAELTKITSARETAKSSAEFGGRVSSKSMTAALGAKVGDETEVSKAAELRFVQATPKIVATPRPMGAHEYAWELTPGYEEILEGQPWDPVSEPRFRLRPSNPQEALERVIKVYVSCKLDDIVIDGLELKDNSPTGIIKEMVFPKMNEAVAVQQLKLTLRDMNLEIGRMDDRFSNLILADILSVPS